MLAQQQSQRQQLKILPQQIQLLNLYFLNSLELQQRIRQELEENPFLEIKEEQSTEDDTKLSKDDVQDFHDWEETAYEDQPDYRADYQNYFDAEVAPNSPIVHIATFKEEAREQLHLLDLGEEEVKFAEYIIDILNPQGLMDRTFDDVADDMSFHFHKMVEVSVIRRALAIVQTLDPVGIGATSIQECLLLQLAKLNQKRPDVKCAIA